MWRNWQPNNSSLVDKLTIYKCVYQWRIEMKCDYGCGLSAKHQMSSGKWCCESHYNKCPSNKKKNSRGLKLAIKEGRGVPHTERYKNTPDDAKKRMNWNKGLFTNTFFEYGGRGSHRAALIEERGHRCEMCKNETWNGKPITLELEHIDGDKKNNIKENLKLLCPNCHSQTPTWRRRKAPGKNKKHTEEQILEAIKTSPSMSATLEKLNLAWGSYVTILRVMKKHNIELTVWADAINQQQ